MDFRSETIRICRIKTFRVTVCEFSIDGLRLTCLASCRPAVFRQSILIFYSLSSLDDLVRVLGPDLVETGNQLIEAFPVDDEAGHAFRIVSDDVRRSEVVTGTGN